MLALLFNRVLFRAAVHKPTADSAQTLRQFNNTPRDQWQTDGKRFRIGSVVTAPGKRCEMVLT
jgi:hypothetical protein